MAPPQDEISMRGGVGHRWWVLATMTGALSMVMIDQTVVSVALATMQRDLHLSPSGLQWVVNAYLLSLAVLVALGGRIADLLGPERTFRAGVALFVLASALCGLARNEAWILAARGLQGVGGAMMLPATGAVVISTFEPGERGRAMGIYSGSSMVFLALGPLFGGLLIDHVSWRAVFDINLPIGVAVLALASVTLPRRPRPALSSGDIDWPGLPLLTGGLGALVLGLMEGRSWGWGSPWILVLLGAALLLLPAFLWRELHAPSPLVALELFSRPGFGAAATTLAGTQFALVSASVFGAIWSQDVLGFSPVTAGLAMLALTVPLLIVAPLAGRVYDRVGARPLLCTGALLVAGGMLWLSWRLIERRYPVLIPGYALVGIGIGCTISVATTDALSSADASARSQASGILQTVRQVGGVIGIAALGAIVSSVSSVRRTAGASARLIASTHAVADAYLVGGAVMFLMAILAGRYASGAERLHPDLFPTGHPTKGPMT